MALSVAIDPRRNRRVALYAGAVALSMLGLGFASVPLYRMFCEATGFGGTTQRASTTEAEAVQVADQTISVRFDGNVAAGMPWQFGPDQVTAEMRIGERKLAYFTARNLSDRPITGVASFNVEPEYAARYFMKIQCFCFNLQTLQPGQTVSMPVNYYVDPAILNDADASQVKQITLSYTFHVSTDQSAATGKDASKALDRGTSAR
ncbi:MAG: cytochrome c oxidase assembly protein [Novosphingobium sp.]|uniref:cytochrome c oxidase assembly protein n=1 Tax=Novosphingobium sp. TaxID=1874826 RepID=UPI0032BC790A